MPPLSEGTGAAGSICDLHRCFPGDTENVNEKRLVHEVVKEKIARVTFSKQ